MNQIDDDAIELNYDEYIERAKQLKAENPAFVIYPPRPGVTYCYAYNRHNQVYRLLTTKEYVTLRDYGLWDKGIDRLKGSQVSTKPTIDTKEAKASKKLEKVTTALILAHKSCTNYEDLQAAIEQILKVVTRVY
jgi:hypothetical protein